MEQVSDGFPRPANGFLVKAELRVTPDRGIGVFAAEFIPANTRVSSDDDMLKYLSEKEVKLHIESLPTDEDRRWWLEHTYGVNGKVAVGSDDDIMINHSDDPTLVTDENNHSYSTRDIQIGEELTEDYRTYDTIPVHKELCEKYGVTDWFLSRE